MENTEKAWVLEKGSPSDPHYATVLESGCLGWLKGNYNALRFARRRDAEMMAEIMEDADRVCEHEWAIPNTNGQTGRQNQ
jgi:hypothetical protein